MLAKQDRKIGVTHAVRLICLFPDLSTALSNQQLFATSRGEDWGPYSNKLPWKEEPEIHALERTSTPRAEVEAARL